MEEKRTQACQYCDRKFISEGTLKRHKNVVHKVQNEFQCELCEFKTKKKEYLTSHFMAIHNKIKLECHICLQVFPSKRCLSRHTKSRHTESVQTYKCDVCTKVLPGPESLKRHQSIVHQPPKHRCDICNKSFSVYENLKLHNAVLHIREKTFHCNQCSKIFYAKFYLDRHVKTMHGNEPRTKEKCEKCEYFGTNLKGHVQNVHENKGFDCTMCNVSYRKKATLRLHVRKVHDKEDVNDIQCPHCQYKTCRNTHMKLHIDAVHLGLKPYKCDICGESFTQPTHVRTHKKNVHNDIQDPRFQCDKCLKFCQDKRSLNEHKIRIHSEMKRFQCEVCDHKTNSSKELKRHSFIHKGYNERPYECDDCNKRFVFQGEVNEHRKYCIKNVGTVEDPRNQCDICLVFVKGKLGEHKIRMHSTLKRFTCEVCGHGLNTLKDLERHSFVHKSISERPFGCDTCKMRFASKSELNEHLKKVCNDQKKKITCSKCHRKFNYDDQLKKHYVICHSLAYDHQCEACWIKFTTKNGLMYHMKTQHPIWKHLTR